jgi:hypothetical protein
LQNYLYDEIRNDAGIITKRHLLKFDTNDVDVLPRAKSRVLRLPVTAVRPADLAVARAAAANACLSSCPAS